MIASAAALEAPTAAYLDHLGFTLISLVAGFAVVSVFRAGAPPWVLVVDAVGGALAGHVALHATKRRLVGRNVEADPPMPGAVRAR